MDSDSSSLDTSSIDDTEARKQYLKAISPKVPPTSHTPVQTSEKAFGNLFSKAGLESDDDTSQPSGANTSVSSESSRKSSMQRSPSSKPSSISKSSSRPSSVRSSLVERESNLGSDSSSSLSDIKPHKPTGAAATSLDDLPESTTSTSMRSKWKSTKNDSVSHSSARDESLSRGSSLASSDDSRKDRREQEHSNVDSTSRKSEASSQTPSRTESRSMPSHASSKEQIESKSSPQDYSDKSARNQESSHSLSQESERSRPQTPESASTSSQVQGIRSGSIQRHDLGSESTSKGELSLQRSNSSQSDSGGPVRTETSSKTSGTEESKEVDSVPLQAEIKGSRVHATAAIPSPPSSSDSKAHTESALSANTQSDHEKSESKDSKGSGSKEILDIEAKRLLGLEEPMNNEPKPKQLPIGVSKESPTERTQSIHDQVDVSPVVRLSEKSSKEVNQVSLPPKSLSQNSSKELKSSPDGHKDSLEEPPIVAAPRISILKKLEERRRALQTQPTTPSEGSHGSGASRCINGKAEDSQSAQEITELTIERTDKEAKQIGDETIDKLTLDDPSSKLDSQSEYDPRKDEREKWKALVKRSALGTSSDPRGPANLRRGRSENSGDEMKLISPLEDTPKEKERKTTDENAYLNDVEDRGAVNNRTREDRNGWVPPALTTYGDNMYSPDTEQEDKLDPPTDLVIRVAKTLPPRKGTSSPSTLHKAFLPPVSEIEVKPPPEDDSSLGSMGFLFPKLSPEISEVVPGNMDHLTAAPVEPKRDPQLVTHRLKPTVGGVDYDYYKSWILPGAQPPQPKQTKILEIEREDPPGTSTVFKPKRVFVNPFPPTRRLEKVMEGNPESSNVQASLANLASESWAPTRPVYIPAQTKSSDEWDAWKEARNASANKDSSNPSAKISIRSDISSTSDWGPPNGPLAPKVRQSKKEVETPRHTGSHWIPPSRSSRLDFAGSITTQATSSTQAQPNYKDPQFSSAREVPPDYQRKSSSTLKSHRSFISEEISSRTPESKDDDSLKHSSESASSSRISSSASTSSRSRQSAPPERKEDLSPVVDELTEEITANPTSTMSGDGHGSTPIRTAHPARAEKKFSRATVCLCVTISLLALGGIVAIVVFILTDRFAQEDSSPVRAPTAPSPTAAPILSAIDLNALIVSTSPGTETSLKTPGSPQSLALSWLSGNQFLAAYSDEKKIQRFVIAVLFYSTSGDSWTQKDLWLSDIDECDWYFSETVNEICNSGGAIDEIDLKDNGLRGEFPWTEIVMLASQLLILDLKGNNISGPISDDVGDLVTLLVFDVQGNGFSGTIPPSFGQLIDTRQLDLSENQLTGSLPSEIASMSSLQSLLVNNNLLTGSIPSELGQLTNVRSIYLSGNNFVGSMPEEICALELDNLEVDCEVECTCCTAACGEGSGAGGVDDPVGDDLVDDELVDDPIYALIISRYPDGSKALANPSSPQRAAFEWLRSPVNAEISSDERLLQRYALASLFYATGGDQWKTSVSWLSQEDECFWYTTSTSGMLCDSNGNMVEIHLRNNNLEGSLPMELLFLANSLEVIDLQGNEITGSIPASIENMGLLKQINLSTNNLFGVIPTELALMSNLRRIELADNNLFSTIPAELGFLTQVEYLDIGSNQLTGTIPESLGSMENLAGLSLYKNFLSGTIPSSFSNLTNLQLFYVDENELTGPFLRSMCQLNLEEFWSDCQETKCTCCTTCCNDGIGCM